MRLTGHPRAQRGQALVFGTLWLVPLLVLLLAIYAAGQYTTAKLELQNAADASAYSVATIAARDYNFSAYMNRAMVANQVAVGQFVGIASWVAYTGRIIQNATYVCDFFPEAAAFCNQANQYYKVFRADYDKVWPPLASALSGWLAALSDVQLVLHAGTVEALYRNLGLPEPGVDQGVLALNDPAAKSVRWSGSKGDVPQELVQLALVINDAYEWWKYTERNKEGDAGNAMTRFADVVNGSLDGFAANRRWDTPAVSTSDLGKFISWLPKWVQEAIKSLLHTPGVWIEADISVSLHRRGATRLKNLAGHYSWAALDTLQEATDITVKFCWKDWKWKTHCGQLFHGQVPIPIGWGSALAANPSSSGAETKIFEAPDDSFAGAKKDTFFAYKIAVYSDTDRSSGKGYKGLSPYYDVADDRRSGADKSATFTLLVSKDASAISGLGGTLYDGSAVGTQGGIGLPKTECASQLYALARGRVRYARGEKYSSLFTPFWEATLSDPGDRTKLLALVTARGASLEGGGCDAKLLPW